MICAAANAAPPAPQPAPPATPPPVPAHSGDVPDEGFFEFLGADDVGDTAWWEFLKKAPPRGTPPPPPQDAKQ
jgi:hypothetical protein